LTSSRKRGRVGKDPAARWAKPDRAANLKSLRSPIAGPRSKFEEFAESEKPMRLKKEQIEKISHLVVKGLQAKKLATFKVSEEKILGRIVEIFTNNLLQEDRLDEEVRKLMEQYQDQIAKGQLDRQKVFQMIKKQLVKERNLVL
jgi:uncharacterized protein DUF507